MESVKQTGQELEAKATPTDAATIRVQLSELKGLWDKVSSLSRKKSVRLEDALKEVRTWCFSWNVQVMHMDIGQSFKFCLSAGWTVAQGCTHASGMAVRCRNEAEVCRPIAWGRAGDPQPVDWTWQVRRLDWLQ